MRSRCWSQPQSRSLAKAEPGAAATITRNTTLHRDIVNCADNGLKIGADNFTLDLKGHKVDGDGALREECPDDVWFDVGILNEGHSGLTVKGGSITDFGWGAVLDRRRQQPQEELCGRSAGV